MADLNMHRLRRAAHRETWYGQSRRANTWAFSETIKAQDTEIQSSSQGVGTASLKSSRGGRMRGGSEPPWSSQNDGVSPEMRGARAHDQPSGVTVEEGPRLNGRHPNDDQIASHNFMAKVIPKTNVSSKTSPASMTSRSSIPKKPLKRKSLTLGTQLRATIFNSRINFLLIAAPVGIAIHFVNVSPVAIFVINFIAIIPLAGLLSYATEEIALRVGETMGSLLNATFGNAVELIVSVIALVKGNVLIVKTSLIGSILSNLLLVMGMSFFFGGLRRTEQFFNQTVATTSSSMLALAIAGVIIPTAFDQFTTTTDIPIAELSRGTAIILLVVYGCYLYFQLKTHSEAYAEEGKKVAVRPHKRSRRKSSVVNWLAGPGLVGGAGDRIDADDRDQPQLLADRKEPEEPQLHIWTAVITLAVSTTLVAFCAEIMVGSISSITSGVSEVFVGLILLPIIGNASEHATAVTVARKDKMDLAIGVTVGSSMQIALLVIPFIVILGWILGNDTMNLSFDSFQTVVLFVSILLVNYILGDGKSNWLEGVLLQCLYLIIAVSAWFYPPP